MKKDHPHSNNYPSLFLFFFLATLFFLPLRLFAASGVVTGSVFAILPLVIVGALVDSINPCAFSVLLITMGFLFSIGKSRTEIIKVGLAYILGIFVVYTLIGLGILRTLQFFSVPHFLTRVGAILLLLWGVAELLEHYVPGFPLKLKIPASAHGLIARYINQSSCKASFLLGGLVGLCEFPCTGGPYLMVLGLLHDKSTFLSGLGYLIIYNFIFVLPLVIIVAVGGKSAILPKLETWKKNNISKAKIATALIMISLGMIMVVAYW